MKRRIRGFSHAAGQYIETHPGKTAQEVVDYLLKSGEARSAAQDPRGSLVATLHKHHRQIGVDRRRANGVYRYYPRNSENPPPPPPSTVASTEPEGDEVSVILRVPRSTADVMDTLIASGICKNRIEAAAWLVNKGISAIRLDN